MANAAAKMFVSFMESQGMPSQYADEEETVVVALWKLENTKLKVFFDFSEDNQRVHIVGTDFITVPDDKLEKALEVVNDCNGEYRWVKFYLDKEHGQILAQDDALIELDSCAQEVFKLMGCMTQIVDEAYPRMMKALWG